MIDEQILNSLLGNWDSQSRSAVVTQLTTWFFFIIRILFNWEKKNEIPSSCGKAMGSLRNHDDDAKDTVD